MTPAAAVAPQTAAAREAAAAPASAVAPDTAFAPGAADDSAEVHYPTWDGRPVAESLKHYCVGMQAFVSLKSWFEPRGDVYLAANTFVYYRRGEPRVSVAPDLFVVRGTHVRERRPWKTWEEGGKGPQFVLEVASPGTRRADRCTKPGIYRTIGVEEYFQFDPDMESDPVLQGLRLVDGEYRPIAPGGKWPGVRSEVLGLDLCVEDDTLRFRDPKTGKLLPTVEEEQAGRRKEKARADNAEARADNAEARADEERDGRLEAEARVKELEARLRSRSG